MELLTNAPVVTAKELTMTKNRAETLLVILETANSVLPKIPGSRAQRIAVAHFECSLQKHHIVQVLKLRQLNNS